jgi:nucleotide-binding universal stress UspA family protein
MMKVLLATDGSRCSEEAAWLLSRLPHRDKLELTMVTVISPPLAAFHSPTKQFVDRIADDDRKFAEAQQAKVREMFAGANAELDSQICQGRAQERIVDCAKQIQADLVVIGAKGHSKIDRILLGSTSDYVATHAHCSVLVVRPTGLRDDPARTLKAVVAYDGSGASQAALEELLEFDWQARTEITVCTVAGYSPIFNAEYGYNPKTLQNEAQNALDYAKEQLQAKVQTVRGEVIEYDHVSEGLVRYTEDEHCDFIVIGDTGRSTLARALLGSVSRYVLRHAKCGVWITRNRKIQGPGKGDSAQRDKMAGTS